jgi:CRISPR-associated Cas5-like protein
MRVVAVRLYLPVCNFRVNSHARVQPTFPAPPPLTILGCVARICGARRMNDLPFKGKVYTNAARIKTLGIMGDAWFNEPKPKVPPGIVVNASFRIEWMFESEFWVVVGFEEESDAVLFLKSLETPDLVFRLGRSENEFQIEQIITDVAVSQQDEFRQTWVEARCSLAPLTPADLQGYYPGKFANRRIERHSLVTLFEYHDGIGHLRDSLESETFDFPHCLVKADHAMPAVSVGDFHIPLIEAYAGRAA